MHTHANSSSNARKKQNMPVNMEGIVNQVNGVLDPQSTSDDQFPLSQEATFKRVVQTLRQKPESRHEVFQILSDWLSLKATGEREEEAPYSSSNQHSHKRNRNSERSNNNKKGRYSQEQRFKESISDLSIEKCFSLLGRLINEADLEFSMFIQKWIIENLHLMERQQRPSDKSRNMSFRSYLDFCLNHPLVPALLKKLCKSLDICTSLRDEECKGPPDFLCKIIKEIVNYEMWWVLVPIYRQTRLQENVAFVLHSMLCLSFQLDSPTPWKNNIVDVMKHLKSMSALKKPFDDTIISILQSFLDGEQRNGHYLLNLFSLYPQLFEGLYDNLIEAFRVDIDRTISALKGDTKNETKSLFTLYLETSSSLLELDAQSQREKKMDKSIFNNIITHDLDYFYEVAYEFVLLFDNLGSCEEKTIVDTCAQLKLAFLHMLQAAAANSTAESEQGKQTCTPPYAFLNGLKNHCGSLSFLIVRRITKPENESVDFLRQILEIIGFSCQLTEASQICGLFLDHAATTTITTIERATSDADSSIQEQDTSYMQTCFVLFMEFAKTFSIRHTDFLKTFLNYKIRSLSSSSPKEVQIFLLALRQLTCNDEKAKELIREKWMFLLDYIIHHDDFRIITSGLTLLSETVPRFTNFEAHKVSKHIIRFSFHIFWESTLGSIASLNTLRTDHQLKHRSMYDHFYQDPEDESHQEGFGSGEVYLKSRINYFLSEKFTVCLRLLRQICKVNNIREDSKKLNIDDSTTQHQSSNDMEIDSKSDNKMEVDDKNTHANNSANNSSEMKNNSDDTKDDDDNDNDNDDDDDYIVMFSVIENILTECFSESNKALFNLDVLASHEDVVRKHKEEEDLSSVTYLTKINNKKGDRRRQHFHTGTVGKVSRPVTFRSLPPILFNVVQSCVTYNQDSVCELIWSCLPTQKKKRLFLHHFAVKFIKMTMPLSAFVSEKEYQMTLPKPTHFPRDRHYRKLLGDFPIILRFLEIFAEDCPTFCLLLNEIRSFLAGLMGKWHLAIQDKPDDKEELLSVTIRMISIISKAQWLPNPLSQIGDILPYISCEDVVICLSNVWSFIMNYPATRDLYVEQQNGIYIRDFPSGCVLEYLTAIKPVFRRNISKIGASYGRFFPMICVDEEMESTPVLPQV